MMRSWLLSLAALFAAAPALAGRNYSYVHLPKGDIYFGHVSYCDVGPHVLRADTREPATVNLPLTPGDTLVTPAGRRCEAQFDTGTILRLDGDTSLAIETILARALSSPDKLTNLQLEQGRVHLLYRDYDFKEVFQVLTPNAAVKLDNAAVVDVSLAQDGSTHVAVQRGSASVLYGPREDRTLTRKLKAGERAIVWPDHKVEVARLPSAEGDAFAAWNLEMNERFVERHDGKSALPKPLLHYPRAVVDFAMRFADPYGEWIWSDLFGYAWRPYPIANQWRPYQLGRWVQVGTQQFWVPDEPWGWVPYHLGLWHWDTKHGWVWIPGSAFAPAWVTWSACSDASYFRPLSLWDWGLYGVGYRDAAARYRSPYYSAYGYWGSGWSWDPCVVNWGDRRVVVEYNLREQPVAPPTTTPADDGQTTPVRRPPEKPLLPLPNDLQRVAERIGRTAAEADVRAAVENTREGGGLVPREKLARTETDAPTPDKPDWGPRFRDWNSDVRAAREVGGRIVYSSESNAVRCEDCRRSLQLRFHDDQFGSLFDRRGGSSTNTSSSADGGSASGSGTTTTNSGNNSGGRERVRD